MVAKMKQIKINIHGKIGKGNTDDSILMLIQNPIKISLIK